MNGRPPMTTIPPGRRVAAPRVRIVRPPPTGRAPSAARRQPGPPATRGRCSARISCLAALLLAAAGACVAADGQVRVDAEMPWDDARGYTPVIVTVSSREARTVTLDARADDQHRSLVEVQVKPGETRRLTLLMPPGSYGHCSLAWRTDADERGSTHASSAGGHDDFDVALVDAAGGLPTTQVFEALERRAQLRVTRHRYGGSSNWDRSRTRNVSRERLPERWQAYPAWLHLIIGPRDQDALTEAQRQAIADWVRTGGHLWVGEAAQVAAWAKLGVEAKPVLPADVGPLAEALGATSGAIDEEPELIEVPGTERVPVGGFLTLALAFAALVGPINLWWVRRRNRRHLFLVTTPAISLLTCAGLLAFSLIAEGLSLRRSAHQFTILDQAAQRAVGFTRATYFAGFAVSRLTLDADAGVRRFQHQPDDHMSGGYRSRFADGGEATIDWRQGQRVDGDWIPARLNRQLLYSEVRPERARLLVERDGSAWRVSNGLGVAIRSLVWRDAGGRLWTSDALDAGASATMTALPARTESPVDHQIASRAGSAAARAWARSSAGLFGWEAELAGPLGALPGPEADDVVRAACFASGRAVPAGETTR